MDKEILLYIHQTWSHPWLDVFFHWISSKGSFSFPLIAGIATWLWAKEGRQGLYKAISLITLIALGDAIGHWLKDTIGQARPCLALGEQLHSIYDTNVQCEESRDGMPSNHALNFFAAFTFLALVTLNKKLAFAGLVVATLVGLSRIYLGVHYPSQVLVGSVIGVCLGVLAAWLLQIAFRKTHLKTGTG